MKRWIKICKYLLLLIIPVYFVGCWWLAQLLTNASNSIVVYRNYFQNEKIVDWNLMAEDGQQISAWFIKKDTTKVVILLAGKGGNRLNMIGRAKYYLSKNYSVVMPDLRGTGNSKADFVSLGYNERLDLLACIDTLKKLHYTNIAAHGHSLGAATIAYSFKDFTDYSFVILESCYDNIDHAFEHRMQKIHLPLVAAAPIKYFAEQRLKIKSKELYPENYIRKINCPVLFLCGDNEWQIPLYESEKLYNNCSALQKYFHVFKEAQHQDFMEYNRYEYINILNGFLYSTNGTH